MNTENGQNKTSKYTKTTKTDRTQNSIFIESIDKQTTKHINKRKFYQI